MKPALALLALALMFTATTIYPQEAKDCVVATNAIALMRGAYDCGKIAMGREAAEIIKSAKVLATVNERYAVTHCADIERAIAK